MANDNRAKARLPAIDSFAFEAILRHIESEIRDDINSIAAICAKSRLSRATEHAAHRPPQGEIRAVTALEAVLEVSSDDGHSMNWTSAVKHLEIASPTMTEHKNARTELGSRERRWGPGLDLLANQNEAKQCATHASSSQRAAKTSISICAVDLSKPIAHSVRPIDPSRTCKAVIARLKSQLECV